ncbi:MAG: hypothetical protein C0391_02780 [Anaerolinea sp.]|nr:hypothetical protein [Anaerolinea sp.]
MDWSAITPYLLPGLVFLTMLVGWLGLIIPIYPGLNIIWLAALVYAIVDGFAWPAWLFFTFITLLMIAGNLADNLFVGTKARQTGASWWSITFGYLAGIIGTFLLPIIGGVVFTILGVLLIEMLRTKDWKLAWVTTKAMAFGIGWAVVSRIALGAIMILSWLIWHLV